MMPVRIFMALAAAVLVALLPRPAFAQQADTFPTRPVTIIIPFEGNTAGTTEFRLYVQSILEGSGKQFIIDHKGGAGTTIGTAYVARSAPDGYTLLGANSSFTITPSIYPDLSFDNTKDLAPISLIVKHALLMIVNPSSPLKTVSDYVSYARSHPNEINFGTGGLGSSTHLPGELLHFLTGTKATFVHYKAPNQRLLDLVAGRTQAAAVSFVTGMPLAKSGKVLAIGVTTNRRVPIWQELPTIEEQGVTGYDFSSWSGLLAPAGTPTAIINRLNGLFVQAIRDPNVTKKLEADGTIMVGSTPAEFRQLIATETNRWKKLIAETGIKLEAD